MIWLLRTKSSAGSASFTKRCRDLPSFRRMGGAHTRNSFPVGPCPAFPGNSRVEKKNAVQRGRTAEVAKKAGLKPAPTQYSAMQLVRGGLGLLSRQDTDEAAVTAPVLELHEASNHREERVVLALPDVFSGLVLGAALAHQDRAGVDQLPAEALDSQPLAVRIAAVCRGAAAFLMCHDVILFEKNCRAEARRYLKSYSLISLTCTAV